ncbi:TetR/AcrR family transcriptional regulator [Natronoglycomyces albus]|uniref:TetR/AcrR family transcriptional regulator n=1 Tax=Natronoglycomyces albus TaxID=2811108 RepID=A0A895XT28_9ACTN|nr:TetR/AcrR family transcriptional regulator [Natronoglycomyces albus]QSB06469.1 TetR/AcrR family transcriptional regulator [Natronoglycomyces albus]
MTDQFDVPSTDDTPRSRRTRDRRRDILRAASEIFGIKGYHNGSLIDIAEQVGMTHAGILHHFGSKHQLLLEVLDFRDQVDVEHLEGRHPPEGLDLFKHLVTTARRNTERPGIVQTYAVLSAESVTDGHPGHDYFRDRFAELRIMVARSLRQLCDPDNMPEDEQVETAASAIIGVMDGLQIQWLLDDSTVDLPRSTAFAIEAIVNSLVAGNNGAKFNDESQN